MARTLRSSDLARVACLSSAAVALVLGCAAGDADVDVGAPSASTDGGGAADARTSDGSARVPEGDGGGPPVEDAGGADGALDAAAGDAAAGDAASLDAAVGDDAGAALAPAQGDVVISEVMYNPSGAEPEEEWIELHNTTAQPRRLGGLVLRDGATPVNEHTIRPGLVIAPGAYVVLASSKAAAVAAQVPAGVIVYDYNTGVAADDQLLLGNSTSGAVVLLSGGTEIARARYGALGLGGVANGTSIQLGTLTYAGAGASASFCASSNAWGPGSDQGTPGAASDCP